MPAKKIAYALRTPRSRVLAVAVVWAAATAFLVMGRPSPDVKASDVQLQNAATVLPTPEAASAPRAQARRPAASTTRPTNTVPATRTRSDATAAKGTAGSEVSAVEPVSKASAVESAATAPRAAQDTPAVTVTGCLEQDDDRFRLKDTAGVEAPRSRSWKSGFLKKGAGSIEVVDAANRLRLPSHVGEWVSVTGTMVDDEMQVRSLQRVAASCKDRPEA